MQQRARERRQTKILLCSFTPIFPSFSLLTSIHCLRSCFSCFITKHKRKVHQKTPAKQAKSGFCRLKHIRVLLSALPGWVVSPSLIAWKFTLVKSTWLQKYIAGTHFRKEKDVVEEKLLSKETARRKDLNPNLNQDSHFHIQ